MSSSDVSLKINGQLFAGWHSVSIKDSLEALVPTASLSVSDRFSADQKPWAFSPDQACEIYIGKELVLTGFADELEPSIDATNRSIDLRARAKLCDLVDCSSRVVRGPWRNITLAGLCRVFGNYFGFGVIDNVRDTFQFPIWQLGANGAEKAHETLARAAKQRGVLLTCDNAGNLIITKTNLGKLPTAIIEGQNVKAARAKYSMRERYSKYEVVGQAWGEEILPDQMLVVGTATDPNVKRNRLLCIEGDGAIDVARARQRAQWEATVRAARASALTVTVWGWRDGAGNLWKKNYRVGVQIQSCFWAQGEMLISGLNFSDGPGGEVTVMDLVPPAAFTPAPLVPTITDGWKFLASSAPPEKKP